MAKDKSTYDEIPYVSYPFPQSHPDRLAAVAHLFGLSSPTVETCRVLELGCSMGGNLIAMAQKYPQGEFVGVDLSSRQIAEGWKVVDRLKLGNVRLSQMDVMDIPENLGEFDYIIAHGVYSWVPAAVQNQILALCKRHLAPNGVAYISYNTFPGWHIRGIVRDMMLFRGTHFNDANDRLAQAKSLVEFVAKSAPGADDPYRKLLQGELEVLLRSDDYYLQHDHLEENNHPVYFHEFARRLGVNGLQYLGEADFHTMVSTNFAPDVAKTLQDLGAHDILQMEQHMDFVRCRYFRQTLICHAAIRLNRQLGPNLVDGIYLSSQALPDPADDKDVGEMTFRTPSGRGITCRAAMTQQALRTLRAQWPVSVSFAELAASCAQTEQGQNHSLANEMLACMAAGVVGWRLSPDPFTADVPLHPESPAGIRQQAIAADRVTNLRGETVTLDDLHRIVLRQLDGTRDATQLVDIVAQFIHEGGHQLKRESDGTAVTDPLEIRSLLDTVISKVLQNLAQKALLRRQSQ